MSEYSRETNSPRGWYNRGYLPHFDGGEILQFITLHLADALPVAIIERWRLELEREKDEVPKIELYKRIENYLDRGIGECYLQKKEIAEQVKESLIHFHNIRYRLISWVIMPNHVHFLIKPINSFALSDIMQKFKSFTAHEANRFLNRSGKFWQEDYFDRYIRDREHFEKTIKYIERNPVRAKLCETPGEWLYSSADKPGL